MENKIANPIKTKDILNKYNLRPFKGLGQNFLVDNNIIDIIVDAAEIQSHDLIIEIGPGIGSLTEALLASSAEKIIAIEKDRKLVKVLNEIFAGQDNLELHNDDALEIDWLELLQDNKKRDQKVKVIANLPYYITTPIIMLFLENNIKVDSLVFMVQKEVAERMVSGPGTKAFGSLTVAVQYYTEIELIHVVPPTVFIPRPNVDSAIIRLKPYANSPYQKKVLNEEFFFKVVRSIFQQRRKTIRNSLSKSSLLNIERELITTALKQANVDQKRRGEKLSIDKMIEVSNQLFRLVEV